MTHVEVNQVFPVELQMHELRSLGDLVPVTVTIERQSRRRINWLFIGTIVVPMALAAFYLFFIAADRYKSEVRFVVRSTGSNGSIGMAGSAAAVSMGAGALSHTSADAFVVNDYILSRDALDKLVQEKGLREIIARPKYDIFSRFPGLFGDTSKERLFDYYKSMVSSEVEDSTGISTVEVTAFRPEDAQELARALLAYAEGVVNRINDRANHDRVNFSMQIVDRARKSLADAEQALTTYRTTAGIVDPQSEYKAALQNITRLSTEASQREAALDQQTALTPNGPAIASLREKVRSLHTEIAEQQQQMVGQSSSLAVKLGRFEQLTLDRQIASKELNNAMVNYEASLQTASEQQLYLQPIAEPNAPDLPYAPKRFLMMAVILGCCVLAYAILRSMRRLAEDHTV